MTKTNYKGTAVYSDGSIEHFIFENMTLASVKREMQKKYGITNSPALMGITEVATGRNWSKMYSFDNWKAKRA